MDRRLIERLRRGIPALGGCVYMNWGACSPPPAQVAGAVMGFLKKEQQRGPFHPEVLKERDRLLEELRDRLGKALGASGREMALTDNTTSGINLIARSFDWQKGDEVIITQEEHPGGYLPWLALRDRFGIRVKLLPLGGGDGDVLKGLEKLLSPRTRLICTSHISWLTGRRVPVRRIATLARRKGLPYLVDAAQSVGQMALDLKRIGCDFYAISGQKWLMGPQGTGALYVRRGSLKSLKLPGAGYLSAPKKSLSRMEYELYPDARRFEVATLSTFLFAGLKAALELMERVGVEGIERRVRTLASRLLDELEKIPGLELLTPREGGEFPAPSGLVSFRIKGMEAGSAVKALFRHHGIVLRQVPAEPPALRASIHYLNLEKEIDHLARAVRALAEGARWRA